MKTVRELITILQTLPPDMRVIVSGYENGDLYFRDPGPITTLRVFQWTEYGTSVMGDYTEAENDSPGAFDAVLVPRL